LGLNTRRVLLFAWLTLFPETGFLRHTSHINATIVLLLAEVKFT
jgi:hypothetical protein